jgi:hypothetical protein
VPERRIPGTSGVKRIDTVVLRGNVEHVVRAFAGDFDAGNEEWLRIDRTIDFEGAEPSEPLGIDILWCENLLVERSTSACVVVLRGCDLGAAKWSKGEDGRDEAGREKLYLVTPKSAAFLDVARTPREAILFN